jgi:hypothetical protein
MLDASSASGADTSEADNETLVSSTLAAVPMPLDLGIHSQWVKYPQQTAKCDYCDERRRGTLQRCCQCMMTICLECVNNDRLSGDSRHFIDAEAADWTFPSRAQLRPSRARRGRGKAGLAAATIRAARRASTRPQAPEATPEAGVDESADDAPVLRGLDLLERGRSPRRERSTRGISRARVDYRPATPSPLRESKIVSSDSTSSRQSNGHDSSRDTSNVVTNNSHHESHDTSLDSDLSARFATTIRIDGRNRSKRTPLPAGPHRKPRIILTNRGRQPNNFLSNLVAEYGATPDPDRRGFTAVNSPSTSELASIRSEATILRETRAQLSLDLEDDDVALPDSPPAKDPSPRRHVIVSLLIPHPSLSLFRFKNTHSLNSSNNRRMRKT